VQTEARREVAAASTLVACHPERSSATAETQSKDPAEHVRRDLLLLLIRAENVAGVLRADHGCGGHIERDRRVKRAPGKSVADGFHLHADARIRLLVSAMEMASSSVIVSRLTQGQDLRCEK